MTDCRTARMRILSCAAALLAAAACSSSSPGRARGGGGSGGREGFGGNGGEAVDGCDLDGDKEAAPSCGGLDCNDRNPKVSPSAAETCDGLDNNCDGTVDEGCECVVGDARPCYGGADGTRHVGLCSDGRQVCGAAGKWGDCAGAVTPTPEGETCDGLDQDCNGAPDDGLTNACGTCGETPPELCGNGLDDDCDGEIDPPDLCDRTCKGVDVENPDPPGMACCFKDPDQAGAAMRPVPYSTICVEDDSLAACTSDERRCIDLDGDPTTLCTKRCYDDNRDGVQDRCVCGADNGSGDPVATDACGFETPCAHLGCDGRTNQPCYTGKPQTLGNGICHGGVTSCSTDDAGASSWGSCEGEQLPLTEICGDSVDNDCDGFVDEENGETHERCDASRCSANAVELCNDGEDNDCDGFVDEGCLANGEEQDCFAGWPGTRGVGACTDGVQKREGDYWGPCVGSVGPSAELCGDGVDSDCDGFGAVDSEEDAGCCQPTGEETCDGIDNDCDGLVDEGVTSACGSCSDVPCYVEEFHEPANCLEGSNRVCSRITQDDNNPDAFSLALDKRGNGGTNVIYLAITDRHQLAKLDTLTGLKQWQVDTWGTDCSRTAVPLDNTVWIANRGFANAASYRFSSALHLDRDGNVICRAQALGVARGMAIDIAGSVWVGAFGGGGISPRLYKFDGSATDGVDDDGLPICATEDISADDPNNDWISIPEPVYGLAFDDRGILWSSSLGPRTLRIDTNTMTWDVLDHSATTYGLAVDGNGDAWFGGFGDDTSKVNANGPYVNKAAYETIIPGSPSLPVTIAHDGYVWVATFDNTVSKIDPVTLQVVEQYKAPNAAGQDPRGIAEDDAGKIWAPMLSGGRAARFDPINLTWDIFDVDPGHSIYTYSDFTGSQLRNFVARQGTWTQIFDSGYATTDWKKVDWAAYKPSGTVIQAFVRFANTRAGLDGTARVCGPYEEPPIDLDKVCNTGDGSRFAALEFALRSSRDGKKPAVGNVQLLWTRP